MKKYTCLFLFGVMAFCGKAQIISTIGGHGVVGSSGDGGPALEADFKYPQGAGVDLYGNVYVCDYDNSKIRKISYTGIITTVAGNGGYGLRGDGGPATAAELNAPYVVVLDKIGNLYIADQYNHVIRIVNTSGIIHTFAGDGIQGYGGDGGPATSARLNYPPAVNLDTLGNVYIADCGNSVIRKVNTSGIISTIAGIHVVGYSGDGGPATLAEINSPYGIAADASGNIYIADQGNAVIRKINISGTISTFAGNGYPGATGDGGPATNAELRAPDELNTDKFGNVYFSDWGNNKVRLVNTSGIITLIAGYAGGFNGDGELAINAKLNGPSGVSIDPYGNIYISDESNIRIRKVNSTLCTITSSISSFVNLSCNSNYNGSATASASGGTLPYTYLWNTSPLQYGQTATGLSAGVYSVTITDKNECASISSVTITQPLFHDSISYSNGGNCFSTGVAIVGVNGGILPYTFLWNPGGGLSDKDSGLTSGTYTVFVTDNSGCTDSTTAIIIQPLPLTIYDSVTQNVLCYGGNNGSAFVMVNGGTAPYTYSWSNGQTIDSISNLNAGIYTIVVHDSMGCTDSSSFSINTDSLFIHLYASPNPFTLGDSSYISTSSSEMALSFTWSPTQGLNCINCADPVASPSVTTTYTVVVNTICGNISDTITIFVLPCSVNNYVQPICIVTVDTSSGRSNVIWGRTNSPIDSANSSYKIYKDSTSGYVFIHNQPLNNLSEYEDTTSDPSAGPTSYELSTVDSCGESALSAPHTTIYLTTTIGFNVDILNWTPYIGFTPSKYRIFRGLSMNTLVQIDSVSNTILTYRDTLPPIGSIYLVEAVNPSGTCIPTTKIRTRNAESVSLSGSFSNGYNTGILTGTNKQISKSEDLRVIPNPSNGIFTIALIHAELVSASQTIIEVYNVLGERIYFATLKPMKQVQGRQVQGDNLIDLSKQADGVYFYRVLTGDEGLIGEGKVVIQK